MALLRSPCWLAYSTIIATTSLTLLGHNREKFDVLPIGSYNCYQLFISLNLLIEKTSQPTKPY